MKNKNEDLSNFHDQRPRNVSRNSCFLFAFKGNCIDPLGMENGKIPVNSLSQNFEGNFMNESRLNKRVTVYPFGWEAPTSQEDGWLQIDLGSINQVCSLSSFQCKSWQLISQISLTRTIELLSRSNLCPQPPFSCKRNLENSNTFLRSDNGSSHWESSRQVYITFVFIGVFCYVSLASIAGYIQVFPSVNSLNPVSSVDLVVRKKLYIYENEKQMFRFVSFLGFSKTV